MSGRISKASGTKITKQQKYKLMEMMKESPQLGYGNRGAYMKTAAYSRDNAVRRWKEIAKALNAIDQTAQKEWEGWRKSWSDMRSKMRDDWSLVVQAHLNQNKRNRRILSSNNKIYKNDDDDHVVTVPKIEPESDDSSSGTDSDLMTNHDGPKILRKIKMLRKNNTIPFNIHHIQIDDDNENNDDDDDDDNDEDDNDEDNEENDIRAEVVEKHQSNNVQRTTRSKSYINPIIIDPPVISIKTKPPVLKKQTNGINDRVKLVLNKTTENLIKNANNCTVRIKKIPNNINEKVNVQNNTNDKKKSSFTNFMKEYVERKAKVKENYYNRKLELLQRDVVAKESMASSLKILINRKRDF